MITDGLTPFRLLLFLAVSGGTATAVLLCLVAVGLGRRAAARRIALFALGGIGAYAALLLVASLASHDRVLEPEAEKHICEVDCHLAYAVVRVKTTRVLEGRVARGAFYVVTVRVRFDEATISPRRGMAPLTPNSRYAALVDARGNRYETATAELRRPLVPGQVDTLDLIFDVPPDARDLRLLLASDDAETRWVIGHENSPFHGKTAFRISA
ncbi:MAG TPA: hypothetical protein VH158_07075 [Gemmatimonadales bacterium]|jgi:hypothetical protein|nr:hypothetical protein [Gemmatimonadales bacterium]